MKILIIIGSFKVGGAERMSINTGEELTRRGYDVYYIVQRPIFEIPHSIPENKIRVLRKKDNQNIAYKISSLFWGIYRETNKIDPDVVIGFSRFSSFLANFTFHSKIIARFDAYPYRLTKKQRIYADICINSPFVKKIIIPSSDMLSALKSIRPDGSKKFTLISNSITASSILRKVENEEVKYEFDYISAMGRLSSQKNFELLISAYLNSSIKEKYKLVIIGDGPNEEQLKELVRENDLEDYVIFTGRLKNPFSIINNSSFFVNPSKFESFGNVILEALLLGKPVIATNCNYGPADMVKNGYNGALISDNSLDEMVEKLNAWGSDEILLKQLSKNAYSSALKFDIKEVGDLWENLIESIN